MIWSAQAERKRMSRAFVRVVTRIRFAIAIWSVAALTGCAVQLSPGYDPELVSGLNATNADAMTLFSALENGASKRAFAAHEDSYDSIIGALGALQIQAGARVVPPLSKKAVARLDELIDTNNVCHDTVPCVNASPAAIGEAITTLSKMKHIHQDNKLTAGIVTLSKNAYVISIGQALAFEHMLKRGRLGEGRP